MSTGGTAEQPQPTTNNAGEQQASTKQRQDGISTGAGNEGSALGGGVGTVGTTATAASSAAMKMEHQRKFYEQRLTKLRVTLAEKDNEIARLRGVVDEANADMEKSHISHEVHEATLAAEKQFQLKLKVFLRTIDPELEVYLDRLNASTNRQLDTQVTAKHTAEDYAQQYLRRKKEHASQQQDPFRGLVSHQQAPLGRRSSILNKAKGVGVGQRRRSSVAASLSKSISVEVQKEETSDKEQAAKGDHPVEDRKSTPGGDRRDQTASRGSSCGGLIEYHSPFIRSPRNADGDDRQQQHHLPQLPVRPQQAIASVKTNDFARRLTVLGKGTHLPHTRLPHTARTVRFGESSDNNNKNNDDTSHETTPRAADSSQRIGSFALSRNLSNSSLNASGNQQRLSSIKTPQNLDRLIDVNTLHGVQNVKKAAKDREETLRKELHEKSVMVDNLHGRVAELEQFVVSTRGNENKLRREIDRLMTLVLTNSKQFQSKKMLEQQQFLSSSPLTVPSNPKAIGSFVTKQKAPGSPTSPLPPVVPMNARLAAFKDTYDLKDMEGEHHYGEGGDLPPLTLVSATDPAAALEGHNTPRFPPLPKTIPLKSTTTGSSPSKHTTGSSSPQKGQPGGTSPEKKGTAAGTGVGANVDPSGVIVPHPPAGAPPQLSPVALSLAAPAGGGGVGLSLGERSPSKEESEGKISSEVIVETLPAPHDLATAVTTATSTTAQGFRLLVSCFVHDMCELLRSCQPVQDRLFAESQAIQEFMLAKWRGDLEASAPPANAALYTLNFSKGIPSFQHNTVVGQLLAQSPSNDRWDDEVELLQTSWGILTQSLQQFVSHFQHQLGLWRRSQMAKFAVQKSPMRFKRHPADNKPVGPTGTKAGERVPRSQPSTSVCDPEWNTKQMALNNQQLEAEDGVEI